MSNHVSSSQHHWLPKSREGLAILAAFVMMLGTSACIIIGMVLVWALPVGMGWLPLLVCLTAGWAFSAAVTRWFDCHVDECTDMNAPRHPGRR